MNIRRLHITDTALIQDVARFLIESFPHSWPNMVIALEEINQCIAGEKVAFVAVEDEKALGFISGQPQYGTTGWELHPLVVSKARQRTGIGSQLVVALEEEIAKQGGVMIYLGTDDEHGRTTLSNCNLYENIFERLMNIKNLKNHPYEFYQKLGYQIVGVLPDANGIGKPDIFMAKRLKLK